MSQVTLGPIGQIGFTVQDLDRSTRFFRDQLGLRYLMQAGSMAFFDCGGIRLMISLPEKDAVNCASILYFKVESISAAHEALRNRGVPFEGEPHLIARMPDHELWMAFFRDPDQHILALMSEVRS